MPCAINTTAVSTVTHYTSHPSSFSPPPLLPSPMFKVLFQHSSEACVLTATFHPHSPSSCFSTSSRHNVYPSVPFTFPLSTDTGLPYVCKLPSAVAPLPSSQGAGVPEEGSPQTQTGRGGERPSVHGTILQAAHLL